MLCSVPQKGRLGRVSKAQGEELELLRTQGNTELSCPPPVVILSSSLYGAQFVAAAIGEYFGIALTFCASRAVLKAARSLALSICHCCNVSFIAVHAFWKAAKDSSEGAKSAPLTSPMRATSPSFTVAKLPLGVSRNPANSPWRTATLESSCVAAVERTELGFLENSASRERRSITC